MHTFTSSDSCQEFEASSWGCGGGMNTFTVKETRRLLFEMFKSLNIKKFTIQSTESITLHQFSRCHMDCTIEKFISVLKAKINRWRIWSKGSQHFCLVIILSEFTWQELVLLLSDLCQLLTGLFQLPLLPQHLLLSSNNLRQKKHSTNEIRTE